jgi:Skp family chaperone for outer membrane proteins
VIIIMSFSEHDFVYFYLSTYDIFKAYSQAADDVQHRGYGPLPDSIDNSPYIIGYRAALFRLLPTHNPLSAPYLNFLTSTRLNDANTAATQSQAHIPIEEAWSLLHQLSITAAVRLPSCCFPPTPWRHHHHSYDMPPPPPLPLAPCAGCVDLRISLESSSRAHAASQRDLFAVVEDEKKIKADLVSSQRSMRALDTHIHRLEKELAEEKRKVSEMRKQLEKDEDEKTNEEIERLRALLEEERGKKRKRIESREEREAREANLPRDHAIVSTYPRINTVFFTSKQRELYNNITKRRSALISPVGYLTDEVINFAMETINFHCWYINNNTNIICFDSLAVTHCLEQGALLAAYCRIDRIHPTATSPTDAKARYWIIPVNETNKHWSLCVYDTQRWILYVLDSMSTSSRGETQKALGVRWIVQPEPVEEMTWKEVKVSQQEDGASCGDYMIAFALRVCEEGWNPNKKIDIYPSLSSDNREWLLEWMRGDNFTKALPVL